MESRMNLPDAVRSESFQPPLPLAPGFNAAQDSSLSPIAQLASDMKFLSRKSSHFCVSPKSTLPLPVYSHVPHSVMKTGIPILRAPSAFERSGAWCGAEEA